MSRTESAADAIAFLATGQLDASFGAVAVALYNAINQGLNVRAAAPIAYDNPELLARKALWDSGAVRSIPDLRGRQFYSVAPASGSPTSISRRSSSMACAMTMWGTSAWRCPTRRWR